MIVLGLTGSIGMGKSTTAKMFSDFGVPVHDSDEAVHRLYRSKAVPLVEGAFPGTTADGAVDRTKLAERVLGDAAALKRLEALIHPLVRADATAFLKRHHTAGAPLAVVDIPLLYETGGEERVDQVVVVTAPADVQRQRVLSRPGMTEEKFCKILAKQVPDAEKRRLADFVIDTGQGMEAARRAVADIIEEWFTRGAADGFNIMPPQYPQGLEAFTTTVVPILQERGLFRTEYTGTTLRDHYGLPRPESQYARTLATAGTA